MKMNFKMYLIILLLLNYLSCAEELPLYDFPAKTIYSIEEINESCSTGIIDDSKSLFNFLESTALDVLPSSDKKIENKLSTSIYNIYKDSIIEHPSKSKISKIIGDMKPFLSQKKSYQIYIIKTKILNAMIAPGGNVFVTTGFLDFVKNDAELAVILGHELGHVENGHIDKIVKRKSAIEEFGALGDVAGNIAHSFLAPFGSIDEYISDRAGLYLAYKAGYDPMVGIEVLKRMSSMDEEKNSINDFFKTHPYSIDRYNCSKKYLQSILIK
jgi:predicted Zn-dependent protease